MLHTIWFHLYDTFEMTKLYRWKMHWLLGLMWKGSECSYKRGMWHGRLGGSVDWVSDFGSGHDLTVPEFEPCVGLCADISEPRACFRFSLPLCHSPAWALSLSLSLFLKDKNKRKKNKIKEEGYVRDSCRYGNVLTLYRTVLMSISWPWYCTIVL